MAAGHIVKVFVRKFDARTRPIGKGLVDLVPDWRQWMLWSDVVILEGNGVWMSEMDTWRDRGCLIIGGNAESASWELDRKKGMEVFRKAGIPIPEFREFTDYDTAISYVERRGEVYYSKPCSDTADKSLSAKTGIPEDPSWMLRKWKKKHGRPPCPFLLQEGIDGVEFAVGRWFGPAGFAHGIEENFEHKRFCAGDVGPNTGEMGTVMRYVSRSKLASLVLDPLEQMLARIGYVGNVDVNCIVDKAGNAWPLEFTMRLGWPAFNIETDLFVEDPILFFHMLGSGENTRGAHKMDEVAVGVVMAIPPYPQSPRDYEEVVGVPLHGAPETGWHPCEMQAGLGDEPYSSAGTYVGISAGTGQSVQKAARVAYKSLRQISMPTSPFYRIDIGQKLKKELPKLQEHGFAMGMEF
jgi:phosphoribosylamine---glycine ligase